MAVFFTPETTAFFMDLRYHNNKAFMDENRARYLQAVREPFYAFIQALSPLMTDIDPDMETRPNKCLSRINRDTRFSKDKSPYRDHLWLAFRSGCTGKEGRPFYWFELAPETVSWGVGIWGENRNAMDAMRRRMLARPGDFLPLLPVLRERGYQLGGSEWKKLSVPEELPAALKSWYCKREIYAEHGVLPAEYAFRDDLLSRVQADFEALRPFYRILLGAADTAEETAEQ